MDKHVIAWLGLTLMVATVAQAQTTVTTSGGTANTIPVFTGSSSIGNSPIAVSGSNVGIGTTTPSSALSVVGTSTFDSGSVRPITIGGNSGTMFIQGNSGGWAFGLSAKGSGGANLGGFGFLGSANALTYYFIGPSYSSPSVVVSSVGKVGIGTKTPAVPLDVAGAINATGTVASAVGFVFPDGTTQTTAFSPTICGGDYAESVDVTGARVDYEPGDVLVIATSTPGRFLKASTPYSRLVAGVFSTKPGTVGRRQTTPKSADEVPLALVGIVPVKVSAENGPINVGDLLVTSSTAGYAMKGTDIRRLTGAVIGKALGPLESNTGTVEVLLALQ